MSDWSNPQTPTPTGLGHGRVAEGAMDLGLRSHMLRVYNYMASGVLLTGIVAMVFARTELAQQMLFNPGLLSWIIILAPLAIVFAMSFGINRMSTGTLQLLFWSFTILMGLSLSRVFMIFTGESIAQTFFASAAAFAGLSLWGYTTKRDLSGWGNFLVMGVIGLIVVSLLNAFFFKSTAVEWAMSFIGVLIFAALTAYDTQKIKSLYFQISDRAMLGKAAIMGALELYLDFINLFLFLLRFMGNRE